MKTKLIYVILIAVAILFAYLWLSKPPKVVYRQSPQHALDSLKNDISKRDTIIYYSNLKLDSLKLKIKELNNEKKLLSLHLHKLKTNYENQIKYINNATLDSNVIYFRTKFAQDNSK